MNDAFPLRAKGHVRAEVYDPATGSILGNYENHNVVVYSATSILAEQIANPRKEIRLSLSAQEDTATVADANGYYQLVLDGHRYSRRSKDFTANNSTSVTIGEATARLLGVTVDGVGLAVGTEVYLADEDTGLVKFAAAQTGAVTVTYLVVSNLISRILEGTETVTVATTSYTRSTTRNAQGVLVPSDAGHTYGIDYDTGEIWFETPKTAVSVEYDVKRAGGVTHMGVGDKPADHTAGSPVFFTENDRGYTALDAEYVGARQIVALPASVEHGVDKTTTVSTNGGTVYLLPNTPVLRLNSVVHSNGTTYTIVSGTPTAANEVQLSDSATGKVLFFSAPPAGTLTIGYRYFNGSVVSFVSDFPQGVPGATVATTTDAFVGLPGTGTTYNLSRPVKTNTAPTVTINGSPTSNYSLSADRLVLTINAALSGGENIEVTYQWDKNYADIYEVALFADATGGDMFAIAGIGPITKDINTGMRVTWTITFQP